MEHTIKIEGKDHRDYVIFANGWSPLSTYYPCPIVLNNVRYRSVEQLYQSMKAKHFGDLTAYRMIMKASSPKTQAEIGSSIENFNSELWDKKAVSVMERAIRLKFDQNETEGKFLLDTGEAVIIFASTSQRYWGNGLRMSDSNNGDMEKWFGENKLEEILMKIRDELKNGK